MSTNARITGEGVKKNRKVIRSRSRWEIILDLLKVLSEEGAEVKKTRLMQRAYLDYRNFQKYFDFLVEQGFIEELGALHERKSYKLTEKGRGLLQRLKEVENTLR